MCPFGGCNSTFSAMEEDSAVDITAQQSSTTLSMTHQERRICNKPPPPPPPCYSKPKGGIKMDWSRETRKQKTFLKLDLDHNQPSFFSIIDDIDRLIKENGELCKLLQNVQKEKQDIHDVNVQLPSNVRCGYWQMQKTTAKKYA